MDATMAFTTFYRPVIAPEEPEEVNVGIMIGVREEKQLDRYRYIYNYNIERGIDISELESRQLPSSPSSSAWVAWPTATAGPRRLATSLETRVG